MRRKLKSIDCGSRSGSICKTKRRWRTLRSKGELKIWMRLIARLLGIIKSWLKDSKIYIIANLASLLPHQSHLSIGGKRIICCQNSLFIFGEIEKEETIVFVRLSFILFWKCSFPWQARACCFIHFRLLFHSIFYLRLYKRRV
jgi:hypothetical protein